MTARDLCRLHGCRVVHFMVHDRVSFGGTLVAIGVLYVWLVQGPLRGGQPWAWWTITLSSVAGFASFFAYLGYGYLDTWHGVATLGLLPGFAGGLARSYAALPRPRHVRCVRQPSLLPRWRSAQGVGRICVLGTAVGLMAAGLTILVIGMTFVLVPQDIAYIGANVDDLAAFNPRLVPLIAHDRAGFGGAVCCTGIILFFIAWCGAPSLGRWWALAIAGGVGFGAAIGIHPAIGYVDPVHLAPAVLGATGYAIGLGLSAWPEKRQRCQTCSAASGEIACTLD